MSDEKDKKSKRIQLHGNLSSLLLRIIITVILLTENNSNAEYCKRYISCCRCQPCTCWRPAYNRYYNNRCGSSDNVYCGSCGSLQNPGCCACQNREKNCLNSVKYYYAPKLNSQTDRIKVAVELDLPCPQSSTGTDNGCLDNNCTPQPLPNTSCCNNNCIGISCNCIPTNIIDPIAVINESESLSPTISEFVPSLNTNNVCCNGESMSYTSDTSATYPMELIIAPSKYGSNCVSSPQCTPGYCNNRCGTSDSSSKLMVDTSIGSSSGCNTSLPKLNLQPANSSDNSINGCKCNGGFSISESPTPPATDYISFASTECGRCNSDDFRIDDKPLTLPIHLAVYRTGREGIRSENNTSNPCGPSIQLLVDDEYRISDDGSHEIFSGLPTQMKMVSFGHNGSSYEYRNGRPNDSDIKISNRSAIKLLDGTTSSKNENNYARSNEYNEEDNQSYMQHQTQSVGACPTSTSSKDAQNGFQNVRDLLQRKPEMEEHFFKNRTGRITPMPIKLTASNNEGHYTGDSNNYFDRTCDDNSGRRKDNIGLYSRHNNSEYDKEYDTNTGRSKDMSNETLSQSPIIFTDGPGSTVDTQFRKGTKYDDEDSPNYMQPPTRSVMNSSIPNARLDSKYELSQVNAEVDETTPMRIKLKDFRCSRGLHSDHDMASTDLEFLIERSGGSSASLPIDIEWVNNSTDLCKINNNSYYLPAPQLESSSYDDETESSVSKPLIPLKRDSSRDHYYSEVYDDRHNIDSPSPLKKSNNNLSKTRENAIKNTGSTKCDEKFYDSSSALTMTHSYDDTEIEESNQLYHEKYNDDDYSLLIKMPRNVHEPKDEGKHYSHLCRDCILNNKDYEFDEHADDSINLGSVLLNSQEFNDNYDDFDDEYYILNLSIPLQKPDDIVFRKEASETNHDRYNAGGTSLPKEISQSIAENENSEETRRHSHSNNIALLPCELNKVSSSTKLNTYKKMDEDELDGNISHIPSQKRTIVLNNEVSNNTFSQYGTSLDIERIVNDHSPPHFVIKNSLQSTDDNDLVTYNRNGESEIDIDVPSPTIPRKMWKSKGKICITEHNHDDITDKEPSVKTMETTYLRYRQNDQYSNLNTDIPLSISNSNSYDYDTDVESSEDEIDGDDSLPKYTTRNNKHEYTFKRTYIDKLIHDKFSLPRKLGNIIPDDKGKQSTKFNNAAYLAIDSLLPKDMKQYYGKSRINCSKDHNGEKDNECRQEHLSSIDKEGLIGSEGNHRSIYRIEYNDDFNGDEDMVLKNEELHSNIRCVMSNLEDDSFENSNNSYRTGTSYEDDGCSVLIEKANNSNRSGIKNYNQSKDAKYCIISNRLNDKKHTSSLPLEIERRINNIKDHFDVIENEDINIYEDFIQTQAIDRKKNKRYKNNKIRNEEKIIVLFKDDVITIPLERIYSDYRGKSNYILRNSSDHNNKRSEHNEASV